LNESTLDVLRGAALTEEQARAIFALGEEAVVFALLELTKQLAEQNADAAGTSHQTPATPSGMKPPYEKPPTKSRTKRPGPKRGIRARAAGFPSESTGKWNTSCRSAQIAVVD